MKRKYLFHLLVAVLFLAAGAAVMVGLTASRSEVKKIGPAEPVPVVRTIRVKTGPVRITVGGEGTVRPLREIQIIPQVSGKVLYTSPFLVNGGEFRKDEVLLTIDPVDYELAVTLADANVKDSESKLDLARAEAAITLEEWRAHGRDNGRSEKKPPPLVVKEPQLLAARAKLEADRAELKKAKLSLERTVLKAPFDGRVAAENVDVGQYVTLGQSLATFYSIEAAEIVVPLESEALSWIHVPGFTPGEGHGSLAEVRAEVAGRPMVWPGRVVRAEGELDEKTRMVPVVIRVDRPYGTRPPLASGLFVAVDIEGSVLPEGAVIPRSALRGGDVVHVVQDGGVLRFRKVAVARAQGGGMVIQSGLDDGEEVVVSQLKGVTDGMTVRAVSEGPSGE